MSKYLSINPFNPTKNISILLFIFLKTLYFQTMVPDSKIIF